MGVLNKLTGLLGRDEPPPPSYECDTCGVTYETQRVVCDSCGSKLISEITETA